VEPRLAVLDMVGTTVEAGPEVPNAFREAFRRVGVSVPEQAVNRVRGRSKLEAIADLVASYLPECEDPDKAATDIHADFRSLLRARYEAEAREVPGAGATIRELVRLGLSVVLTTGLDRDTAACLVRGLGWEGMGLGGFVAGDDVARGRPAPDLIHAAMGLVTLDDPACVVVVGDTVADLEAAAKAEVGWSVGVLTGAHNRDQLGSVPHSAILASVALLPGWLSQVGVRR